MAINIRGDAELFSIMHKRFLQVLREDVGPFRPLVSAIFYGHSSLALAYADRPDLQVIPDLIICGDQQAREIQLLQSNKQPYPRGSSCMLVFQASRIIIEYLIFCLVKVYVGLHFQWFSHNYLTFSKGFYNRMQRRTHRSCEA